MKIRTAWLLLAAATSACAGKGSDALGGSLGAGAADAGEDGLDADAPPEADAADPSGDADSPSPDAGPEPDASDVDAAEPDAAVSAFRIQVSVQNPREHQNPIAFALNDVPVAPDAEGYLQADEPADTLAIVLGGSDETQVLTYQGIANGDALTLLYRHFREDVTVRSVLFPTGQPPVGATSYRMQSGFYPEYVAFAPSALARFYIHGAGSFLVSATDGGATSTPLGFSFLRHVDPALALVEPPALGPWVAPRTVALQVRNAPSEVAATLRMLSDGSWFDAPSTGGSSFAVPPGFADGFEAHLGTGGNGAPVQAIIRCGPEADQMALDFADVLPPPAATQVDDGTTVTYTFEVPPLDSRGDVIIFRGIVMPASQATLTLPSIGGGASELTRVDIASVTSWAEFKQRPLDLGLTSRDRWCYGTDVVRISSAIVP